MQCLLSGKKLKQGRNQATDGIDMKRWDPKRGWFGEQSWHFRCFDFGGQEIFYPTHELFLSSYAAYVVVFNMKRSSKSRIEYWLQKISARCSNGAKRPFVVVVGTNSESATPRDAENALKMISSLRQRFDRCNIAHYAWVSCTEGDGLGDLREYLSTLPLDQPDIPRGYEKLASRIRQMQEKSTPTDPLNLPWSEFVKEATSCDVHPDSVLDVAQFFHDAGLVVFFRDGFPRPANILICNPQALANVMAAIISFKSRWSSGFAKESEILSALRSFGNDARVLIALLEKFEILFRLRSDPQRVIIPSVLPLQRPALADRYWPSELHFTQFEVNREYVPKFVPLGLFPRIIYRCEHLTETRTVTRWRDGLVLVLGNSQKAKIEFSHLTSSFSVTSRVLRSKPRLEFDLFLMLIDMIDTLLENYYSFEYRNIERLVNFQHPITKKKIVFTHGECLAAFRSGQHFISKNNSGPIRLDYLVPDLALSQVPQIAPQELEYGEMIGEGGFGIGLRHSLLWLILFLQFIKECSSLVFKSQSKFPKLQVTFSVSMQSLQSLQRQKTQ